MSDHEENSIKEAGGCAAGFTGHFLNFNADAEAKLADALMAVGKYVQGESGCLLGHIKAAVVNEKGEGITLNLIDMDNGVEHHGTMPRCDKANFNFMCAVLDVDEYDLTHRMLHAIDDSGLDYFIDKESLEHHHHHHHDGDEHEGGECDDPNCSCHEHHHHHDHDEEECDDPECDCHKHHHEHDHDEEECDDPDCECHHHHDLASMIDENGHFSHHHHHHDDDHDHDDHDHDDHECHCHDHHHDDDDDDDDDHDHECHCHDHDEKKEPAKEEKKKKHFGFFKRK